MPRAAVAVEAGQLLTIRSAYYSGMRSGLKETCQSPYARAAELHERAGRSHDEAAGAARLAGDVERELSEREFAEKERKAAQNARNRDASFVGAFVSLGL